MPNDRLDKYVQYIRNTGRRPLPTAMFDDDWDPIGPAIRAALVEAKIVTVQSDGIRIVVEPTDAA